MNHIPCNQKRSMSLNNMSDYEEVEGDTDTDTDTDSYTDREIDTEPVLETTSELGEELPYSPVYKAHLPCNQLRPEELTEAELLYIREMPYFGDIIYTSKSGDDYYLFG